MNIKKLTRLYAEEKLQVRKRGGRKRALGARCPIIVRNSPTNALDVDTSLSKRLLVRVLDAIITRRAGR